MKKAIMAKKIGMTQIFTEDGRLIPVTVLEAGPCSVVQKKTMENDGYEAIQVGFLDQREKLANKPKRPGFPLKSILRSSDLRTPQTMRSAQRSRLTYSQQETE